MIEALLKTTEVLPKGWRRVQLGDVLSDIIGGGTPSRDVERYWNGDIPWITVKDMRTRRPEAIQEHITEAGVNECATNIIPADTVITATRVGLGKVVRVPYPAAINQDLKALIVGPDLNKDYLEWWIISQANYIESIGSGTTVKGIRLNQLKELKIPLPPLPQQRRIVEAIELQLGRLDAAVARLQGAKARLKRYKQAVLKGAVEGRLTEEWREKNSDVESAERIVERIQERRATIERTARKTKTSTPAELDLDNLPSLPEGWMWSTLPQLGELNRGKSKHRPRDDKRLYGGPYPFIQTGDVRYANGRLTEYTSTYSEFGLAQSRLWPAGTMCITIAANIADTAVLEFDACFPDSVVGFIPEEDSIDVHFAELYIRTVKQDIERYAPATAQKNINLEVLRDVAIALPPRAEQAEIMRIANTILTTTDETEATLDAQLQQAVRLRQAVLKRAFEGRLG